MTLPKTITGGLLLLSLLLLYFTLRQVPPPQAPGLELPILELHSIYKQTALTLLEKVRNGRPLNEEELDILSDMHYRLNDHHRAGDADEVEEVLTLIEMVIHIHEQLTDGGFPRSDRDNEPPGGSD